MKIHSGATFIFPKDAIILCVATNSRKAFYHYTSRYLFLIQRLYCSNSSLCSLTHCSVMCRTLLPPRRTKTKLAPNRMWQQDFPATSINSDMIMTFLCVFFVQLWSDKKCGTKRKQNCPLIGCGIRIFRPPLWIRTSSWHFSALFSSNSGTTKSVGPGENETDP